MNASTTWAPGAVTTRTDGAGDPFLSKEGLYGLMRAAAARPVAAAPAAPSRGAARASRGGRPVLREKVTRAPTYSQSEMEAAGRGHSWVQNMHGPNQVGGFISTNFGPRAAYGGYDPTYGAGGPVKIEGSHDAASLASAATRAAGAADMKRFVDEGAMRDEAEHGAPPAKTATDEWHELPEWYRRQILARSFQLEDRQPAGRR